MPHTTAPTTAAPASRSFNILVIDDEQTVRDMLTFALDSKGYHVVTATAANAVDKFKSNAIDLVVCDLKMPETGGLKLLRMLKEHASDFESIVVTGFPDLDTTLEALRFGAFDYIAKPFDLEQLYSAIEKALNHQRETRALISAEEMNRMRMELLLNMGHEFKTRMESSLSRTQSLLNQNRPRSDWGRGIGQIQTDFKSMFELISDILELPGRSSGHLATNRLDWQEMVNRFSRLRKPKSEVKVLLVDDDPDIIHLLSLMLTQQGYSVETATDGQLAVEMLAKERPDFLLLDLMLPKLNGFQVLDRIAEMPALKDLPIVVLTARYLSGPERQRLMARVESVVEKGQSEIHQILTILNEHNFTFRQLSSR